MTDQGVVVELQEDEVGIGGDLVEVVDTLDHPLPQLQQLLHALVPGPQQHLAARQQLLARRLRPVIVQALGEQREPRYRCSWLPSTRIRIFFFFFFSCFSLLI